MIMAENKHRFLFEIRPDLFPEGYLTITEVMLWDRYYVEQKKAEGVANG